MTHSPTSRYLTKADRTSLLSIVSVFTLQLKTIRARLSSQKKHVGPYVNPVDRLIPASTVEINIASNEMCTNLPTTYSSLVPIFCCFSNPVLPCLSWVLSHFVSGRRLLGKQNFLALHASTVCMCRVSQLHNKHHTTTTPKNTSSTITEPANISACSHSCHPYPARD